jgi:hypothetical protein
MLLTDKRKKLDNQLDELYFNGLNVASAYFLIIQNYPKDPNS